MRILLCLLAVLGWPAALALAQSAAGSTDGPPVASPLGPADEPSDAASGEGSSPEGVREAEPEASSAAAVVAPGETPSSFSSSIPPSAEPAAAVSAEQDAAPAAGNSATKRTSVDLRVTSPSASAQAVRAPSEHPLLAIDNELFLGALAITGWGIHHWKWFTSGMKMKIEHGFTKQSSTGGSDKTGHFFAGFVAGDLLAWRLRQMGYDRLTSALWGATGSMALMTWIEIGDSTSKYGWSFEDMAADFVGVAVSALLGISPDLDRLLDFRVQYWPTKGFLDGKDVVADYSGMKHLVAVKLSGIPFVRDTPLRFLEAQVGFYSRGFRSFDVDPERRVLFLGIGVTATEILSPVLPMIPGIREVAPGILTFFEYYQPPILGQEVAKAVYE